MRIGPAATGSSSSASSRIHAGATISAAQNERQKPRSVRSKYPRPMMSPLARYTTPVTAADSSLSVIMRVRGGARRGSAGEILFENEPVDFGELGEVVE